MITIVKDTYQETGVGEVSFPSSDELFSEIIKHPQPSNGKKTQLGMIFSEFKEPFTTRTINTAKEVDDCYFGLDIDEGMTIADFKIQFKEYRFWLYSTSSHSAEKNKFRVVMKGSLPKYNFYDKGERDMFRSFMVKEFPFIDKSALGPERILYMPTASSTYISHENAGKSYEFNTNFARMKKISDIIARTAKHNSLMTSRKKTMSAFNGPTTQISDWATWATCNKSGVVQEFINLDTSYTYASGCNNRLYRVLLSAKTLKVSQNLIDDVRDYITQNNNTDQDLAYFQKTWNAAVL